MFTVVFGSFWFWVCVVFIGLFAVGFALVWLLITPQKNNQLDSLRITLQSWIYSAWDWIRGWITKEKKEHGLGWIPDVPDHNDYILEFTIADKSKRARKADLRPKMPPVYDQGKMNTCTANVVAAYNQYLRKVQGGEDFMPSRLFNYYTAREIEHTTNFDRGVQIRDAVKAWVKNGICREEPTWKYDPSKVMVRPSNEAYAEAEANQAIKYYRIYQRIEDMETCLFQEKPIMCGIALYESFKKVTDGNIPLPAKGEKREGAHGIMLVGYDADLQLFTARNSWGPLWGKGGYFTISYKYILSPDLACDFWTVLQTE